MKDINVDNTMKIPFEISIFDMRKMRADANKIAKDMSLTTQNEKDAFRHAYVSAKMQETYGEAAAKLTGHGNEYAREVRERLKSRGAKGNPDNEWNMDVYNNNKGLEFEAELADMKLEPEQKERMLRERIAESVRNGELQTDPNVPPKQFSQSGEPSQPSDIRTGPTYNPNPTTLPSGAIQVRSYIRESTTVRSHTRSRPDDDVGNNLSFRSKALKVEKKW